MTTTVVILPTFTCAACGGTFNYRHSCPTMPWAPTATPPQVTNPIHYIPGTP